MKYFALVAILFICSCNKDSGSTYTANAIVYGSNDPLNCGWVIQTDSLTQYHPDNLSPEFEQNNLKVFVVYTIPKDTFTCSKALILAESPVMHIMSIKR